MTTIAQVAAFRDAVAGQGADVVRMKLSTVDAQALVHELLDGGASLRHTDALKAALVLYTPEDKRPDGDEALLDWASREAARANAFWDAFQGEVVEGVEIIRKRA